jgi:protease IV
MRSLRFATLFSIVFLVGGCGTPSFLVTPVSNPSDLNETVVQKGKGLFPDKIAIIEVEGILSNSRGGLLQPGENPLSLFKQELDMAADDDSVKAVVLRVNSPGGTVSSSDAMYTILKRFKDKTHKPVVASAQELDCSGAYYLSCGADKIVAQPTSLVGSIGVIFESYNIEGTMAKIGVRSDSYKSAAHKDIGSPFRDATPEEQAIMQGLVDEYYARFKSIVTSNRPIPASADFKQITDGRIFSGENAVALGLVDKVGLLSDAIDMARDMANAPNASVIAYKRSYADGGSIYALNSVPPAKADVLQLQLPQADSMVPSGFYYLWQP